MGSVSDRVVGSGTKIKGKNYHWNQIIFGNLQRPES